MTVSNDLCRVTETATGNDAVYPYTFRIQHDADLVVEVQDLSGAVSTLVLNTDYTVDGVLSYTGGNVTLLAGNLAAGYIITIFRDPEPVQDTSLQQQGAYDAKAIENALDFLTYCVQALADGLSRAPQVPGTATLPAFPSPEALALIGWNAAADGFENYPLADLSAILATGNFTVDVLSAGADFTPGSSTTVTLSKAPGTVNNTLILFDGVPQQKATYSVADLVVTFTSPIPLGVFKVEVTQSAVLPLSIPADNSVATATIQALAVDETKMADDSVPTRAIQDRSVLLANLGADALQGGKNGVINGAAIVAQRSDYAATVSGTYAYGKADRCKGALTGTTVAGTLTQATASSLGRTGRSFKWSAVTTTGAGIAKWRFFIESKDAIAYKNQTCTVRCLGRQDTGGAINFAIVVSKANAADDFSATTVISTGANVSVPSATNTSVPNRAIAMGDCSNGIMIEVTAAIGAVTNKNMEITELQFELGSYETDFEFERYAVTLLKCQRYFWPFAWSAAVYAGVVVCYSAGPNISYFNLTFPNEMRIGPAPVASGTWRLIPGAIAVTASAYVENSRGVTVQLSAAGLTPAAAYILSTSGGDASLTFDADF